MSWLRRAALLLPALALILLATSCDDFFVSENSIQSVTVTPTSILLKAGDTPADTYTLSSSSTTVNGTSADDTATATWSSSNTAVVTVAKGIVTAVGSTSGTATVTAKDGGATSNAVNVLTFIVATPANLLVVAPSGFVTTGAAPGTYQFHAYLGANSGFPDITNNVTWSSSDTTAATVNATTGVVTVLSVLTPTSVTITATANVGASAPATQSTITGTLQFTAD